MELDTERLQPYIERFIGFYETEEYWNEEREYKEHLHKTMAEVVTKDTILAPGLPDRLQKKLFFKTSDAFINLIGHANAYLNFQGVVENSNDEEIQPILLDLVYGKSPIEERLHDAKASLNDLAKAKERASINSSIITIFLSYMFPNEHLVWKPRYFKEILNSFSSGVDLRNFPGGYVQFLPVAGEILSLLKDNKPRRCPGSTMPAPDMMDVTTFIYVYYCYTTGDNYGKKIFGGLSNSNDDTKERDINGLSEIVRTKRQIILYGPPGTSKTYEAKRLAKAIVGADTQAAKKPDRIWWLSANTKRWRWESYDFSKGKEDYSGERVKSNFIEMEPGDMFVGYQGSPTKAITAIGRILTSAETEDEQVWSFDVAVDKLLENGITYEEMRDDPILSKSQPIRMRCQGTLLKLEGEEVTRLSELILSKNPDVGELLGEFGEVTRAAIVQFHPSYTYEDFVRGLVAKPIPIEEGGGVTFEPEDKIFAQLCSKAEAYPERDFVLIIDEINRADMAKVFGELIYGLEYRGRPISTPYEIDDSKELTIPDNLYIIGTMNTADKSIALLDYAIRRRFSFYPLYPNQRIIEEYYGENYPETKELALNLFDRVSECFTEVARDLQIGHTYFMVGEKNDAGEIVAPNNEGDLEPINDGRGIELLIQKFIYETAPLIREYIQAGEEGIKGDKVEEINNAYTSGDCISQLEHICFKWITGEKESERLSESGIVLPDDNVD